jgi:outer membrane protein W
MIPLKGGLGYGAELNFKPNIGNLDITFFLSTEYFAVNQTDLYTRFSQDTTYTKVPVAEKFFMVPLELGVKWDLPVSSDRFKVYIGGGGGLYFGNRTRTIANSVVSYTTDKKAGFSLNILSGADYYLERNLSANFEIKFREASFDVESRFNQNTININGQELLMDNPVYSRIIVDGVRLSLGLKYNF